MSWTDGAVDAINVVAAVADGGATCPPGATDAAADAAADVTDTSDAAG